MIADPFGHAWFIATPERRGGARGDAAPLDRRAVDAAGAA